MDAAHLAERLDTTHEVSVLFQSPTLKQVAAHTGNLSTRLHKPLAIFEKKKIRRRVRKQESWGT